MVGSRFDSSELRGGTRRSRRWQTLMGVAAAGAILTGSAAHQHARIGAPAQVRGRAAAECAVLPLAFEPDRGQPASGSAFVTRGAGYSLSLTNPSSSGAIARLHLGPRTGGASVRMALIGARSARPPQAESRLPGVSNYLIGRNPRNWKTGVPHFAQVRFAAVYPGVDLVYHGSSSVSGAHSALEYDFQLQPNADPAGIRLAITGTQGASLAPSGDLILHTAAGDLVQERPIAYQKSAGQRRPVSASFTLESARGPQRSAPPTSEVRFAFQLGPYDHSQPLVIDPSLQYSTHLGGTTGTDSGNAIAVDADGSAYVTGEAESTDFPVTSGAFQTTGQGGASSAEVDAFVTKMNSAGTALVYSTYLGGSGDDIGYGITVNPNGDPYITGSTNSTDFPTTTGAYDTTLNASGDLDAFVTELNADGTQLIYSTYLGGDLDDQGNSITLDSSEEAWIAGTTSSGNFPTSGNAPQSGANPLGNTDAFAAAISADGTGLVFATYLGGSLNNTGTSIALTPDDTVYVAGTTYSVDFPTTSGVVKTTHLGTDADAFIVKMPAGGGAFDYATYLGGDSGDEDQVSIAVDATHNAYVLGRTASSDFPVHASFKGGGSYHGNNDMFLCKLNGNGTSILYASYLGGSQAEGAGGIALDSGRNVYVTGSTESTNFPTSHPVLGHGESFDATVTEIDPTGKTLIYSTYLGGTGADHGRGIAVDAVGAAYVTGVTQSSNFPTTSGAYSPSQGNAFITIVLGDPPAAPSNLKATVINRNEIDLSWTDNSSNETGFEVDVAEGSGSLVAAAVVPANTITYSVTGLVTDQPYTFAIRAYDSGGYSPYSNQVTSTPTAAGKLSVSATSINFGTLSVGGEPRVKTFKIHNLGLGDLTVSATLVTGTVFSLVPSASQTLAEGKSATYEVTFTPTTKGTFADEIQVTSNARSNASAKIKLKGIGK